MRDNNNKQRDLIFLAILLIVQTGSYLLALHLKQIYFGDSLEYIQEAANIRDHFFFYSGNIALPIREEYMTLRPPLYPLFVSAIYLFAVNNWVVLFFQNVLSVINIVIARDTMLYLGYKRAYDWLFLLFIVLYPAQFMFSNIVYADILLQTFSLLYFRQFVLFVYDRQWKHAWGMSLMLIVGAMVKPIFYPFAALNIIVLLLMAYNTKVKLNKALAAALLPVAVFLLYNSWNYSRTGKFHFSSIESINANYNCREYDNHKIGIIESGRIFDSIQQSIAVLPTYKIRYDSSVKIARRFIKERAGSYALFHLLHSARLFVDPGKSEIDFFMGWSYLNVRTSQEKINQGFYATVKEKGLNGIKNYVFHNQDPAMPVLLLIFIFNCVRLAGFCLFVFSKDAALPVRVFILLLMGYFSIVIGPVANTHYFLPISLIMIGAAVIGLQNILKRKHKTA